MREASRLSIFNNPEILSLMSRFDSKAGMAFPGGAISQGDILSKLNRQGSIANFDRNSSLYSPFRIPSKVGLGFGGSPNRKGRDQQIRCVDIIRFLEEFHKLCKVGKMFSKHLKFEEQEKMLNQDPVR